MKLLDVNVVLAAYRADHPDHTTARAWLEGLLESPEQFGVPWTVWWSFLRLTSHPRVFEVPTLPEEAFSFIAALQAQPGHVGVEAGPRHREFLQRVIGDAEASSDLIPDAVLAALALEHGCQVVSFDRDFARFPGLGWVRPATVATADSRLDNDECHSTGEAKAAQRG